MATASPEMISTATATTSRVTGFDQWVCLPATRGVYVSLLESRGERSRPKYTYLDGGLTVVSPGHSHESLKTRLAALVDILLEGLSIDFHASGEVTLLTSTHPRSGSEPDASYYLTNLARVVGKQDVVMGEDPPPDLVIEVVVSHPEADAVETYRHLGVREVWVCKRGGLDFLTLGPDGLYVASPRSTLLPSLASEELVPWVYRIDASGEREVRRQFRAWVEETLAPRARAHPHEA